MTHHHLATGPTPSTRLPIAKDRALGRYPRDGLELARPYSLGRGTTRVLRGLISVLLPPPPAPRPDDIVLRVERTMRLWTRYMHPLSALGLWLTVRILDLSPWFLLQSTRRLSRMPQERGSALLDQMVHGRFAALRMLVVAIRGVVLSAYFDQDEVHRAIDYHPVAFLTERIATRERLLARQSSAHHDPPPLGSLTAKPALAAAHRGAAS